MTRSYHLARCATTAIAAALALGSTSLVAQSTDASTPTVIVPPAAPVGSTAATPAIVPPAPSEAAPVAPPPVQVSRPVVQQVPPQPAVTPDEAQPSAAPATTARSTPAARSTTHKPPITETRAAAPPPAATTADTANGTAPVAPPADTAAMPPAAPITNDVAPVISEPAISEEAQPASEGNGWLNLILIGGLIVLALIAIGMVFGRARRRKVRTSAASVGLRPVAERPAVTPPAAAPVADPALGADRVSSAPPEMAAIAAQAQATRSEPTPIRREPATLARTARSTTPGALPSAGAAVDLPARLPESFGERDALLKRMVAARPDKANPFTNRKSRTRRARLILQSLDRKFEHADSWIDLSQYPNNWPELARRYSQAA